LTHCRMKSRLLSFWSHSSRVHLGREPMSSSSGCRQSLSM
jgi:hypothetical protein